MKLKIFFILISFLVLYGCQEKTNNKTDFTSTDKSLSELIFTYNTTGDIKYLEQGYVILQNDKEFNKSGLTQDNYLNVIQVLFNLKRYSELESLLSSFDQMNHFERITLLNTIKGLNVDKYDPFETVNFFYQNIDLINDTIKKSPNDSLLYVNYFVNRMFIVGKQKTLKEIDSMKNNQNKYSDIFYEQILKKAIKRYPNDKMPSHLVEEY